jgi:hypothetical protein
MSQLKVKQIKSKLLDTFADFLDTSDLKTTDSERETKILTRCLAAMAVVHVTGCDPKLAAASVWDGEGDNGIDAAYYDPTSSQVVLVQSKWINKGSGEPEAKDIGVFADGVMSVVEQEADDFSPRLKQRFSDISIRLNNVGTSINVVLISTGASSLAAPGAKKLEKILDALNGSDPDAIASSQVLGLNEVYKTLASEAAFGKIDIDTVTLTDWSLVADPYQAYFGIIDGYTLKMWWKEFGRRLVSANIRHSLGATDVNIEIKQTAQETPEKFWYFNNGITLIADATSKAPAKAASRSAGSFSFTGVSIVNGAQTVSTLSRVEDDDALAKVKVAIRIVILDDAPKSFGADVTRTNNLQNRVEARDFAAQDPEQSRMREEMAMEGIDYQLVRSDESIPSPTSCDLMEITAALACATGTSSLAVQVKSNVGRFFADIEKAPYKTIFNPSVSGARAFNAVLVQRHVDSWIAIEKQKLAKKSGKEWGVLVHGNRVIEAAVFLLLPQGVLDQPISQLAKVVRKDDVFKICTRLYPRMIHIVNKNYPDRFMASLFKNQTMSKDVFDTIVKKG